MSLLVSNLVSVIELSNPDVKKYNGNEEANTNFSAAVPSSHLCSETVHVLRPK
jgi:hypothetical protein